MNLEDFYDIKIQQKDLIFFKYIHFSIFIFLIIIIYILFT
jgi:hypothetical protein